MEHLRFSKRARRKARRHRLSVRLGVLSLAAAVLGVPGANLGYEFLSGRLGGGEATLTQAELQGVTTSQSARSALRMRRDLFKSRPTPSPSVSETPQTEAATEVPAAAGSVTEILYAAAAEFGIDPGYLVSVASCESGLNPGAVNPAGYHGLFQFDQSTWAAYGYGSIYDPVAQGRTAARMLAAGMASRWPNCA